MVDVKWIKLTTNIFENRKIRQIECLPDGDSIIVVWVKLLCLAGNINDGGCVYLTKEIPYTDQMLATQFGRPLATVQLALRTFTQFGMIEIVDDILCVSNWEKYQNVEGMERIREQTRKRVAKYRENQKQISCNVTVTQCNATDKNKKRKEEELDKDILDDSSEFKPKKPTKHKYGEYNNVLLTDEELDKLKSEYSDWAHKIENLSSYVASTGKSYKSHYATIRNWARKDSTTIKKPSSKITINDELNDLDGLL